MSYLSTQSRARLNKHFAQTRKALNIAVGEEFNATPSVAQTIYNKIVEDGNAFLASINVMPVSEMKGEKIGLSLSVRIGRRTNTGAGGTRTPKTLDNTSAKGYELFATEFDIALDYAKIDAWAKFPDFSIRYMTAVRQAIGNDMLQTGWTGTSAAAETNISTNPLLQDLNKGWLQILREFNSGSQYLAGTPQNPVLLGGTDFVNLDVLVHNARQMLPIQFRQNPDLVVLVGADVLANQEETYFELNGNKPSEKAMMSGLITRAYGGLPTLHPAFMPNGTLLITSLKNLSIYYQDTSVRRTTRDWPDKNQVQEFNSVNLGYVLEDELQAAFIENITLA